MEEIRFIEEGSRCGSGIWTVGVNVIVDGKTYSKIFRKEGLLGGACPEVGSSR